LKSVIKRGGRRVLLSGAADTGLMALVAKVFADFGVTPDLTLVDRCRTVIEQNRLCMKETNREAALFAGSVLDFHAEPFDVIYAHSFMLFFATSELSDLARTWRRLLKPDGIILSTDYMATSVEPVYISPMTEEEIEATLASIEQAAKDHGMNASDVAELRRCTRLMRTELPLISLAPLLSVSEIRNRMMAGGLEVVRTSMARMKPNVLNLLEKDQFGHFSTVLGVSA
jgi:SAM-dependent methyltransferase